MKIIEEPIVDYQIKTVIISAQYISGYKILLTFDDEIERAIDFENFLISSQHPSIQKYLDITQFKKFELVNGNLNWNDYDMIFPLSDLKKGQI